MDAGVASCSIFKADIAMLPPRQGHAVARQLQSKACPASVPRRGLPMSRELRARKGAPQSSLLLAAGRGVAELSMDPTGSITNPSSLGGQLNEQLRTIGSVVPPRLRSATSIAADREEARPGPPEFEAYPRATRAEGPRRGRAGLGAALGVSLGTYRRLGAAANGWALLTATRDSAALLPGPCRGHALEDAVAAPRAAAGEM